MSDLSRFVKKEKKRVARIGRKAGLSRSQSQTLGSLSTGGLDSEWIDRNVKQVDRALDKVIGIDNPETRNQTQVAVATVLGAVFGGGAGGAVAGGAIGGVGLSSAAGPAIGANVGAAIGSTVAGGLTAGAIGRINKFVDFVAKTTPGIKPPRSFGGDILSSQSRLRRLLASKRGLRSTNRTGGISGILSGVRPTLMTL